MVEILSLLPTRRLLALSFLSFLSLLAVGACAEASSKLGVYHRGRTLDISVVTIDRVRELRYSTIDPEQVIRHYRLTPGEEGAELILMRLKVENHTATSVIVNVDDQAAELRDFFQGKYFPIDVASRVQEVPDPPGKEGRSIIFITGPLELRMDTGVDGWMVFEAPKGTKFRELRWRAADSLSIEF
jgi:hypothetical protein